MTSFPYRSHHHLAQRVEALPPGATARRWVIRDDNQRHHHGVLPLSANPAFIELHWKPDERGREQLVGLFRLDLPRLLEEGYVRLEREDDPGEVRLRFLRGDRGVVLIQARADAPALAIGTVDVCA